MKTAALSLVCAFPLLAACGSLEKKEPPPKPFAGTRWQVQLELPVAGEQPWMRLGDGRVEGFSGCNRFNARYLQDSVGARAIAISGLSATKRGCDPSTMAAESRMLETLSSVSSYSITGEEMAMSGSAGTLKLKAIPAP